MQTAKIWSKNKVLGTMYLPNIDNQSGMQWTLNANIVWYIYSMHHSIMLAINSIQCLVTLTYLFQQQHSPPWNEKAVVDSQLIFQPLFEILNLILFEYSSVVYCQELPSSHHINQSIGWWLFCNKMEKFVQSSIQQVWRKTQRKED